MLKVSSGPSIRPQQPLQLHAGDSHPETCSGRTVTLSKGALDVERECTVG